MGVGKKLIKQIKELHPEGVAKVKIDNKASLALFKSCGFKEAYFILE
jgi:L-amino acid N-acyltransferase YncA